jgi:hypothetical protein
MDGGKEGWREGEGEADSELPSVWCTTVGGYRREGPKLPYRRQGPELPCRRQRPELPLARLIDTR